MGAFGVLWFQYVAHASDYPTWRNDGSGASKDTGLKMVDSWDDARLLWMSEAHAAVPLRVFSSGRTWPVRNFGNGGYANPVIVNGRIYLTHWQPSGPKATAKDGAFVDMPESEKDETWMLDGDDVVICIDTATGKTIWRTVMKSKGFNFASVKRYGGHLTVCVDAGRVYVPGCIGRAYCLDAKTGKVIWDISLGRWADAWAYCKARHLKDRALPPFWCQVEGMVRSGKKASDVDELTESKALKKGGIDLDDTELDLELGGSLNDNTFNTAPVVAAGVVFFGDPGGTLIAVDAKSGKELWRRKGALKNPNSPSVWRHKGKSYILSWSYKDLNCHEPRSGKRLWKENWPGGVCPTVSGDYVLTRSPVSGEGLTCLKLSLEGATKVWSLPSGARIGYSCPMIWNNHVWQLCRGQSFPQAGGPGRFKIPGYADDIELADDILLCVELETGKTVSHIPHAPSRAVQSLTGADGRLVLHGSQAGRSAGSPPPGLHLYDITPKRPRYLGHVSVNYGYCVNPLLVDGKVYYKDADRLLGCYDLRAASKPGEDGRAEAQAEETAARDNYVRYDLELEEFLLDGSPLRLHLGHHNGRFDQAWATAPPHYNVPFMAWGEGLTLRDGRLSGRCKIRIDGIMLEPALSVSVRDGKVAGKYTEPFDGLQRGGKSGGKVDGSLGAIAETSGTVRLELSTHWHRGNPGRGPKGPGGIPRMDGGALTMQLADGRLTGLSLAPCEDDGNWTATVHSHGLKYADGLLSGRVEVSVSPVEGDKYLPGGRYVLGIEARDYSQVLSGKLTIIEGYRPGRTYLLRGALAAPKGEAGTPSNGAILLTLHGALVKPRPANLLIALRAKEGRVVDGHGFGLQYGHAPDTTGLECMTVFSVDAKKLKVTDEGLTGSLVVDMPSDGRIPAIGLRSEHTIDVKVQDGELRGKYRGRFAVRAPRSKPVSGRVTTDP